MTKSELGLGVHTCEAEAGKWRVLDQPELQSDTRKGDGEEAVKRSLQCPRCPCEIECPIGLL